ncbi:MAG TPA: hypothetical protein VGF45_02830 [Polyangia bacterium]
MTMKPSTTLEKLASAALVVLGALIALGAYGHGFVGRLPIDAELAKHPIDHDTFQMLYVVWHFVTGAMLLCGAALIWAWSHVRRGDRQPLFIANLIGVLYLAVGLGGIVYRNGDPFMIVFIAEGALVLLSAWALRTPRPETSGIPAALAARTP